MQTRSSSAASWSLADGNGYMLDRNFQAASRLNCQHYLWREVFRFSIHPSIQLPCRPVIADIATGTGLWLIDVAREYPDAQLHGLDVDLTQAPPSAWLPNNASLTKWNIFHDVPPQFVGKFDLVHARLLICVLSGPEDRARAINNLLLMLKPGGYIQWDDMDIVNIQVKKVNEHIETPAMDELLVACRADGRHDWLLELPRFLVEAGFQQARMELFDEHPGLVRAFGDLHLCNMTEFADRLVQMGGREREGGLRFYEIVREADREGLKGAAFCIPRLVAVGRKPGGKDGLGKL